MSLCDKHPDADSDSCMVCLTCDAEQRAALDEVAKLKADNERLRGLVKWAEGGAHRQGECPWCGHDVNGEFKRNHRLDCAAFTLEGDVR